MRGYIYRFRNVANAKSYVGSTFHLRKRKILHLHLLRHNKHHSPHFQAAWNKHGEASFEFEILEEQDFPDEEALRACENAWLVRLSGRLYNSAPVAMSALGIKRSQETRDKIRKALVGRIVTPETRARMSEAQRRRDPATRNIAIVIAARTGAKLTAEHRRKIGESNRRRTYSDATRQKMSEAMRGRKHTDQARANMAAAQLGRTHTQETKDKIRNAHLGKAKSAEGVAKQSATLSGRPNGALVQAPDGTIHRVFNVTAFAREHNLKNRSLSAIITGKRKSHKGWVKVQDEEKRLPEG